MFPIRDTRGRTIGFGGRVLDSGEPKYLNSPETELFSQGPRTLRPLRRAAGDSQPAAVAGRRGLHGCRELHQAAITYAVATLGTATTPEHLSRIFRLVARWCSALTATVPAGRPPGVRSRTLLAR